VPQARPVKTRRRGDVLLDAVLDAAWKELSEKGWAGFRIDAVAQRAGTGKAVLYRRWPNRAALARDAAQRKAAVSAPQRPPSGDLRQDLLNLLEDAGHYLEGPFGAAARAVFTELDPLAPATNDIGQLTAAPVGIVVDIVDRAKAQGLLGPNTPGPPVLNVGIVLVTQHYLLHGHAPEAHLVAEIVDTIWLPALRDACASR